MSATPLELITLQIRSSPASSIAKCEPETEGTAAPARDFRAKSQVTAESSCFSPFLVATGKRVKRRPRRVPAAIPPAPPLSGGQFGAGEGGWPGNRRADVNRLAFIPSPRSCSPAVVTPQCY